MNKVSCFLKLFATLHLRDITGFFCYGGRVDNISLDIFLGGGSI